MHEFSGICSDFSQGYIATRTQASTGTQVISGGYVFSLTRIVDFSVSSAHYHVSKYLGNKISAMVDIIVIF
jgi:hypothetical protein